MKQRKFTVVGKPTQEPKEVSLSFSPCLVCGKVIKDGYYGRWLDGGVCSRHCNSTKEQEHVHIPTIEHE